MTELRSVIDLQEAKNLGETLSAEEEELLSSNTEQKEEFTFGEQSYSREQVQTFAEESMDFLAALAMPEHYEYQFPIFYLALWDWLKSFVNVPRTFPKLALGIPRGFSKTTVAKLWILYCILFTQKKFIFVICATGPKAEAILSDIADMLDESNIKRTFGDWRLGLIRDTQDEKKFTYRGRTIILASDGAQGKGIRGKNIKNERPDVILFDDIQTKEDSESDTESEKIYRWMLGTAMYSKSHKGCMFMFLANMYPTDNSILKKLKKSSHWLKFISGCILEDGTSLWEELQPINQLLEDLEADTEAGHPEIFLSEKMNDEDVNINNSLDTAKIIPYSGDLSIPPEGKFIIIDPATGKPGSNNVAIGLYYVYNRKSVLVKIKSAQYSPLDAIKVSLEICAEEGLRAIFIESNAYQATFLFWFNFICEQLHIEGINLFEMPARINKNTRIRDGYKKLLSRDIYVSSEVRPIIVSRFKSWRPLKKNNDDDELDLIGFADKPLEQHWSELRYDILDQSLAVSKLEQEYYSNIFEVSSPF